MKLHYFFGQLNYLVEDNQHRKFQFHKFKKFIICNNKYQKVKLENFQSLQILNLQKKILPKLLPHGWFLGKVYKNSFAMETKGGVL